MSTLRARQKQERQDRIVGSAKALFKKVGFDRTTIESIADAAGVSSVTVHNYYGTKSGVLLALVNESDSLLIEKLEASLPTADIELLELTLMFARQIMDHAIATLEKNIWRQVVAAVTSDAGSQLSMAYRKLDQQLADVLVRRIESAQRAGTLQPQIDALHLGRALFQLQNARFIQFISFDGMTQDEIELRLRNDLTALFAVGIGGSTQ